MLPFIFYSYGFENILRTRIYDFSPIVKFFQINIGLLIFNIIPLYPLDGGRILRSYLTKKHDFQKATKIVMIITYIIGAVLIIIGIVFDFLLIVLALFIYAGAHGKSKYDRAADILHLGDKEMKEREREQYEATRKRLLSRTEQLRIRAEEALQVSRVSSLAKIFFKFRDSLNLKFKKGKLNQIRELNRINMLNGIMDFNT
jgi:hypothetical protein